MHIMKLFAIRHGDIEYPYDEQGRKLVHGPNAPLSNLGKVQIHELGRRLTKEGIVLDAVYTSPYLRAQQTAKILSEELSGINKYTIDGLKDVFPCSAEGKTWEDLEKIGADIYTHPFSENQESLEHLVSRARSTIETILVDAKQRGYDSIAIVSHGDTLSAIDWTLRHPVNPASYLEMRDASYLQKAQVFEYPLDDKLRLSGEGRLITVEQVKQSVEAFRNPSFREIQS